MAYNAYFEQPGCDFNSVEQMSKTQQNQMLSNAEQESIQKLLVLEKEYQNNVPMPNPGGMSDHFRLAQPLTLNMDLITQSAFSFPFHLSTISTRGPYFAPPTTSPLAFSSATPQRNEQQLQDSIGRSPLFTPGNMAQFSPLSIFSVTPREPYINPFNSP